MRIILFVLCTFICSYAFCQVDNLAKNKKVYDELYAKYEKELKEMPNSALPHLNFANSLSKLTFRASEEAPKYYIKAMEADSTNPEIYRSFGDYLIQIDELEYAYESFQEVLKINPMDTYCKEKLNEIKEAMEKKNEYAKLHRLPFYEATSIKPSLVPYKERVDYENLTKKTQKGKFSYLTLSEKYVKMPSTMTDEEMFYLLVGQFYQSYFNPYNYDDEEKIQKLTADNQIKEATTLSKEILLREPLNILILRELLYCYRVTKNEDKVKDVEIRLDKIFRGMLFSGNGSCEEPFWAVGVREEYVLCAYLGYQVVEVADNQSLCAGQMTDKLLTKNIKEEELYFHFNYIPLFRWTQKK